MKKNAPEITVGTILKHSVGSGFDEFYQVTERHNNTVVARRIENKYSKFSVRHQTCKVGPYVDKFSVGSLRSVATLRLKMDQRGEVQIGPLKRLDWWSVWDGTLQEQRSP